MKTGISNNQQLHNHIANSKPKVVRNSLGSDAVLLRWDGHWVFDLV